MLDYTKYHRNPIGTPLNEPWTSLQAFLELVEDENVKNIIGQVGSAWSRLRTMIRLMSLAGSSSEGPKWPNNFTSKEHIHECTRTHTYTYIPTYIHTYIHMCIYICIHIYIYVYMYVASMLRIVIMRFWGTWSMGYDHYWVLKVGCCTMMSLEFTYVPPPNYP